jgi:hypothetical protein
MSEEQKDLPKKLPDMEIIFTVDNLEGKLSKKVFSGEFKYRMPTLKGRAQADKMRADLNGGLDAALDKSVLNFHYMIAYLRFSLAEFPDWWKRSEYGYNLYDYNVVEEVYKRCSDFEKDWMLKVWGKDVLSKEGEDA